MRDRIAIALDTSSLADATALVRAASEHVGVAKVGLQLFSAEGPHAVAAIRDLGMDVFVDLKLHDIPHTVRQAATVLGRLGATYVTVHASGGAAMVGAAVEGFAAGAASVGLRPPAILAVTVLTSDAHAPAELLLERLAAAVDGGAAGVICAAPDVPTLKAEAPHILAVTPGIRSATTDHHDQARVATPALAIGNGADVLVVGRDITAAHDPATAAAAIAAEVSAALDQVSASA
ncbi:MAG: orotidine-5'-phosphate decarboxylase [Actinomycetales bacterium]